jgi:hypothetical protein
MAGRREPEAAAAVFGVVRRLKAARHQPILTLTRLIRGVNIIATRGHMLNAKIGRLP